MKTVKSTLETFPPHKSVHHTYHAKPNAFDDDDAGDDDDVRVCVDTAQVAASALALCCIEMLLAHTTDGLLQMQES